MSKLRSHNWRTGRPIQNLLIYVGFLLTAFVFTGCKKLDFCFNKDKDEHTNSYFMNTDEEFRKKHKELSKQNLSELKQVRAATEKYRNIENAFKDGYADISVVVPNMGHHYMKSDIVDGHLISVNRKSSSIIRIIMASLT